MLVSNLPRLLHRTTAAHGKSQLMGCLLRSSWTVYPGTACLHNSTAGSCVVSDSVLAPTHLDPAFCAPTRESQESLISCMQAQQEMQLAGAARSSPLQVPLTTEQPQAIQALPDSESNGNASGLMQEAAEAVQQVPYVKAFTNAYCDIASVTHSDACVHQSVLGHVSWAGMHNSEAMLCSLLMYHHCCIFCCAATICLLWLAQLSLYSS